MRSNTKDIYFKIILQNIDIIWKFLNRPNDGNELELENYNNLPKNPGIATEKIAEYFSKEEKDTVLYLWKKFDIYIKDYWTDEYGTIGQLTAGRGIKDAEITASKLASEFLDFFIKNRMYADRE
jgi:hypothetical protein